jgi:hypothetical protein
VTVFASAPDDPVGRVTRTVSGIGFSFRPPSGWERFGTISINRSIVGPQDADTDLTEEIEQIVGSVRFDWSDPIPDAEKPGLQRDRASAFPPRSGRGV